MENGHEVWDMKC